MNMNNPTEPEQKPKPQPYHFITSPMNDATTDSIEKVGTGNPKWDAMYHKLIEYRDKHKNCLVPNRYKEMPQLGSWVSTQRRHYKMLQGGKDSPLTEERLDLLTQIDFVWATRDPRHVPWEQRYQELLDYREKYGNCLIPVGYEDNPQLANWVSTQRQERKLFTSKKPSRLTEEKISLLNKVDFVWEAQRGGARAKNKTKRTKVSSMYKNSKKSKMSINSSTTRNTGIRISTSTSTNAIVSLKRTPINDQRLQSTSLTPVNTSSTTEVSSFDIKQDCRPWISVFKDYLWFLDQARNPEEIPVLRQWAMNQREEYKRQKSKKANFMLHSGSSKLTYDQFNLLQSINFDWNHHSHHDINMPGSESKTASQLKDVDFVATTAVAIPSQLKSSSNNISSDEMSAHHIVNCHSDSTETSDGQAHVLECKDGPCYSMKKLSTLSAEATIEADAAEALFSLCTKK